MDRRTFLERGSLGALVALVAACGDAGGITSPVLTADVTVRLADLPDIATPGTAVRLPNVSPPIALVNAGPDGFHAYSLICPHAGTTVRVGSEFTCPNHGARFDLGGRWTGGERTGNLRSYRTDWDPVSGTVIVRAG